jgi:AraC-like DNA-binding protein
MVITTEILPCPAIQSFVRCYTLREFNTAGSDFLKPLPANHEFTLAFTLSGSLSTTKTSFGDIISGSQHIFGLQTSYKGCIVFNGNIRLFTIQFRPNGFYKLFNIPAGLLTNKTYKLSDIINKGIPLYIERLNEASDISTLRSLTDTLLLSYLSKSKKTDPNSSITFASSLLFQNQGNVNIRKLAYDANMCLRTFEQRFTEQVGISPKMYARLTRFNHAILIRIKNTSTSWTDISYQCGYYDQMHFIKEFKQFAGESPSNFYKSTPLPSEDYREYLSE